MDGLFLFDVQHFCFQDGPGIRTTVFAKGCSLRCRWCHNPESLRQEPELLYYMEKCVGCGLCTAACPVGAHTGQGDGHRLLRHLCTGCGGCVGSCPARALELAGRERDIPGLLREILQDREVYTGTGGGVTLSGGEPLLQPGPAARLLAACREQGLHTAVETAGNVPPESLLQVLPHTSLLLWDMKAADPALHQQGTGADNKRILANLALLAHHFSGELWVRVPVIPGFNDTPRELRAMAALLQTTAVTRVELLPYHDTALPKYQALELPYPLGDTPPPTKADMETLRQAIQGPWQTL